MYFYVVFVLRRSILLENSFPQYTRINLCSPYYERFRNDIKNIH